MSSKLPIMIIIPHGGCMVPEELSGYEEVDSFDIFMSSDTCANDMFGFTDLVIAKIDSHISRLFIDMDRPFNLIPPVTSDGVIKTETPLGRKIYMENFFPDEIALSNILKRYYFPFHNTIEKIIETGDIKLIIECHIIHAVGPKYSSDEGMPRPAFQLENIFYDDDQKNKSCRDSLANDFSNCLKKAFSREKGTISDKIKINDPVSSGFLLRKYGGGEIPYIKLSVTRSLFLNEKYFSYEYMKVDDIRIKELKNNIWQAIEKLYSKIFS